MLYELGKCFAPSGSEGEAVSLIKTRMEGKTDNLGSFICGEGKIAIVSALDEPGVFVSEAEEKVRICPMGSARPEWFINRKIRLSGGSVGFVSHDGELSLAKCSDLYLECEGAKVGEVGCIEEEPILGEDFIITKAPLRVASVGTALKLSDLENVKFMFTSMYCIGKKGLNAALFRGECDTAIVIDTVDADDKAVKIGGGPVIKMMDGSYTADFRLRDFALSHDCQKTVVKTPEIRGEHSASFGATTAYVSVPVKKIGGLVGRISTLDLLKTADFIKDFIKTVY